MHGRSYMRRFIYLATHGSLSTKYSGKDPQHLQTKHDGAHTCTYITTRLGNVTTPSSDLSDKMMRELLCTKLMRENYWGVMKRI
jgi:hypothetical protein